MRELSLNVMDIAQNSISAGASLIEIVVAESAGMLNVGVYDNGKGMSEEQAARVTDPFFTTRTTRPVGLGVPLFKMASEQTGGSFSIQSKEGEGTRLDAVFVTGHIDMTPIGDMNETILLLVIGNPDLDFVYTRKRGAGGFTLDTRELREALGNEVPLNDPEVADWIRAFLKEGEEELPAED